MDERILTENPRRQVFSRIGWAFTAILVITSVLQILLAVVPALIWGEDNFVTGTTWGMWLVTFVPMYLVAVPVGLRILKPLPLCPPQDRGLKLDKLLALLPISYCVMYAGNLIGTVLSLQLSGGEAQRVKLSTELSRRATGKTVYVLDEPTTGLHFADVEKLIEILHKLKEAGNTVVVIEHNLDVIKTADYIIDMGPEGGDKGGTLLSKGTPEEVAKDKRSYTGYYIKKMLERDKQLKDGTV